MKLLLTYFMVFLLIFNANSQSKGNIRGSVVDKLIDAPIAGADILLLGSSEPQAYSSNEQGDFEIIDIKTGRYSLFVSKEGYYDLLVSDIVVYSGKEVIVKLELGELSTVLNEVIVKSKNDSSTLTHNSSLSVESIDLEQLSRFAGTANDPSRLVSSMAGVNSVDGDNDLIIRGNSPVGMIWQLEGIEIPNPNHFSSQGSSGGRISMLNSNVLSESKFYTGGFPAEYGNGFSGVFDVSLRSGNNVKREYAMSVGIMGTDISLEGPLFKNKKSSYLINYRYSTLAMLNKIGVNIVGDIVPNYQDLTFNLKYQGNKIGQLGLFGLLGTGNAKNQWTVLGESYNDRYQADLLVTGLKHQKILGPKIMIKSVGALTISQRKYQRNLTLASNEDISQFEELFLDPAVRLRTDVIYKQSSKSHVQFGGSFHSIEYDHNSQKIDTLEQWNIAQSSHGSSFRIENYFKWRGNIGKNVLVQAGYHYTYFDFTGENRIEPRFGIDIQISDGDKLSARYGQHSKSWDLAIYNVEILDEEGIYQTPNVNLEMLKSNHFAIGFERYIKTNIHFEIETYFQYLTNVPIGIDSNSVTSILNLKNYYPQEELMNKGVGFNYGTELVIEKKYSNNWYGKVTASLFNSKYRAIDSTLRNTRWNNNYIFNLLVGKEFSLNEGRQTISLNSKVVWSGGNRVTPIDLARSQENGKQVFQLDQAYEEKMRDYFRLDFKVSYSINNQRATHSIVFDIQNLTNQTNYASQYFDATSGSVKKSTHLGIIPTFGYKLFF